MARRAYDDLHSPDSLGALLLARAAGGAPACPAPSPGACAGALSASGQIVRRDAIRSQGGTEKWSDRDRQRIPESSSCRGPDLCPVRHFQRTWRKSWNLAASGTTAL